MAPLELAARAARAWFVAADAAEFVTRGRASGGLDVRAAVDRRRGVLESLGLARPRSGRDGGGLGRGWPGVSAATLWTLTCLATLATLVPLVPLVTLAALAALAALGTLGA